ncbi:MAG: hypothetical protein U0269_20080 [Polyangiales bacterium]
MHTHALFYFRATTRLRCREDRVFTLGAGIAMLSALIGIALVALALVAMSSLAALTAAVGALSGAPRGANAALTIVRNLTLALITTTAPPRVGDTRRVVSGYLPRDCSWRVFLPTGLRSSELTAMRRVAILVAAYGLLMYLTAAAVSIAARRKDTHEASIPHA